MIRPFVIGSYQKRHMLSNIRFQVSRFIHPEPKKEEDEEDDTSSVHTAISSKSTKVVTKKRDKETAENVPNAPPNTTQDTISTNEKDVWSSQSGSTESNVLFSEKKSKKRSCTESKTSKAVPRKKGKCLNPPKRDEPRLMSTIYVPELGHVPVVKGDPKVLPQKVLQFVAEKVELMRPRAVYICDGSIAERDEMIRKLKTQGVLKQLDAYLDGYNVRTSPEDVARVEAKTFVTTENKYATETRKCKPNVASEIARWMSPELLSDELDSRFPGCMRGRMMYVIPFSMGPIGGFYSKATIQLTDSPYVVLVTRIMARVSLAVLDVIGNQDFIKCIHSVGVPRPCVTKINQNWPCVPSKLMIAHRMEEQEIWSFGSGYGGNSLLGKVSVALRLATVLGKKEGWLAEHMAIISLTNPEGKEYFIAVGMPSGAGKTNLALMQPNLPGWTVKTIGDDIAWLRFGADGQMYAMNPENGMFGVAAESNEKTNYGAMKSLKRNFVITNVADTKDGRFYWQGLEDPKSEVTDWRGKPWQPGSKTLPAHANSRFAVQCSQNPMQHPAWEDPKGVPITAIIYGGKRPDQYPLVFESFSWRNGVFQAASMKSEGSAGSAGPHGLELSHDPMGMRPFIGYNFADYLTHWMSMDKPGRKLPKIFHVNWFRRCRTTDKLMWPGFGDNIRVFDWILRRCSDNPPETVESPLGLLPKPADINISGLQDVKLTRLLWSPKTFLEKDVSETRLYFEDQLGKDIPREIDEELCALEKRIAAMPSN